MLWLKRFEYFCNDQSFNGSSEFFILKYEFQKRLTSISYKHFYFRGTLPGENTRIISVDVIFGRCVTQGGKTIWLIRIDLVLFVKNKTTKRPKQLVWLTNVLQRELLMKWASHHELYRNTKRSSLPVISYLFCWLVFFKYTTSLLNCWLAVCLIVFFVLFCSQYSIC